MTLDELRATLRVRQGDPDLSDVPETWITEGVRSTLLVYARRLGPTSITMIPGIINETDYTLDKDIVGILDAFWNTIGRLEPNPFSVETVLFQVQVGELAGLNLFETPSLLNIWYGKVAALKNRFGGKWEAIVPATGGDLGVRLMPAIKIDGDPIWLLVRKTVDNVAKVPEQHLETFIAGCLAEIFEIRANRAAPLVSVSFQGQSIQFGQKQLFETAERYRKKFDAGTLWPIGPSH